MMGTYAIVEIETGLVINTIVWDGIAEFSPYEGCLAIETSVASIGWTYADGEFSAPPVQPPTPAEVLDSQSAKLQAFTLLANSQKAALTNRVGTLNDAIELEMATPEEESELPVRIAQLKQWKTYAVLLGRVTSQAGWYTTIVWPDQPVEGMDLTVSSEAPQVT